MNNKVLKEIIQHYGTPTYIFEIKKLKDRIEYIKNHLPKNIKICYAVKANTFIVKDIEKLVYRYEVCSLGEYEICREKEIQQDKILISGVNKTQSEIERITKSSKVRFFSIESMNQFELLKKCNENITVLIRITSGNQFGINKEDAEEIIKNRNNYPNIKIKGIQYFSGTQKTSIKILKKEIEKMDEFLNRLKTEYNFISEEFELGTGFPVNYFHGKEFDEENYFKEFSDVINNMQYEGNIILEIGRSISASCGSYLTKVIDTKKNKDQNYAIVDGGMNHLVYYGQSMAMKVPYVEFLPERPNENNEKWNICGSLCTINDILIKQLDAKLEIGDMIIFKNTGAYCMTEGISLFLSRDLPKIIKVNEDDTIELIRDSKPIYKLNY